MRYNEPNRTPHGHALPTAMQHLSRLRYLNVPLSVALVHDLVKALRSVLRVIEWLKTVQRS